MDKFYGFESLNSVHNIYIYKTTSDIDQYETQLYIFCEKNSRFIEHVPKE